MSKRYTISDLEILADQLDEAKGPSRILDAWLHIHFGRMEPGCENVVKIEEGWDCLKLTIKGQDGKLHNGEWGYHVAGPLTSSTDWAIKMMADVLPSAVGNVSFGNAFSRCDLVGPQGVYCHGTAKTPPLAIMLAMVKELKRRAEAA